MHSFKAVPKLTLKERERDWRCLKNTWADLTTTFETAFNGQRRHRPYRITIERNRDGVTYAQLFSQGRRLPLGVIELDGDLWRLWLEGNSGATAKTFRSPADILGWISSTAQF